MSRYTYAGNFVNPTTEWKVEEILSGDNEGKFQVVTVTRCECGHACCSHPITGTRPLNPPRIFDDEDTAHEYITSTEEFFEQDYDNYLEENGPELARMELYEMWRREY